MFSIYIKHTATHINFPNDHCHTAEHKLSVIIQSLSTYYINEKGKKTRNNKIKQILYNSKYHIDIVRKMNQTNNGKNTRKERKIKMVKIRICWS